MYEGIKCDICDPGKKREARRRKQNLIRKRDIYHGNQF